MKTKERDGCARQPIRDAGRDPTRERDEARALRRRRKIDENVVVGAVARKIGPRPPETRQTTANG